MNKPYKIRDFNKATAQVIVEYQDLAPMAIDLVISDDGRLPTGEELDAHIQTFFPVWHFERLDKLKNGVNPNDAAAIEELVEPVEPVEPSDAELEGLARAHRDALLLASDWTQLPDAGLSEEKKALWVAYRQTLRDVPQQSGFPREIVWPELLAE